MQSLQDNIKKNVALSLSEDIGSGDLTAALIDPKDELSAQVLFRESAVLCGTSWFNEVFQQLDQAIQIDWSAKDGDLIFSNQAVCQLKGPARAMLTGERSALNFLQTLSATATITRQYVNEIAAFDTKILDTRKTVPGLRIAQKYATRCGGAMNHRIGLFDKILIKENHIEACGSVQSAVEKSKHTYPNAKIEIEVETLAQVDEAIGAGADILLLDNFNIDELRKIVILNKKRAKLEASGNIDIDTLKKVASTGVDFISVGALTKHVKAVDLSMRFIETS